MKLQQIDSTLMVTGLVDLNASNAVTVRDAVRGSLVPAVQNVDFDLSVTRFVDSSGLGALISIHKTMMARGGTVRVLNPTATVEQVLEVTRLNRLFEIIY